MASLEGTVEIARLRDEGERAERATLWPDAAAAYEQALSLLAGAPDAGADEAALLTALGRCYWRDGQARPAWRTLRRAIALHRERGDAAGMARATAEILSIWGPPERQRAMADEALEALGDNEPHLRAWLLFWTRRREEALALAERYGFEDILPIKLAAPTDQALDEGRIDEFMSLLRQSHAVYARLEMHHIAANQLRYSGFALMQAGLLRDGTAVGEEAREYARRTHLRFHEQLALMDLVGAAFARNDVAGCAALLDESPGDTDFRADLYRMWMAQRRGDLDGAMRMLIDPSRAGGAPTAISQIHGAAAGMLFAGGMHDAARRELEAWAEAARPWGSFVEEAAVPADCLVALAEESVVREVRQVFAERDARTRLPDRYSTLQGRGLDDVRGALALRLGETDEAERHYRAGFEWAEREGCDVDAGRCVLGLGDVARRRGDDDEARRQFALAGRAFETAGALYELERARKRIADVAAAH